MKKRIKPIQDYMKSDCKICKFCGRPESDSLHFRKKAHVISANVGNRVLTTLDECDECNEETGIILESDFAKYIQPLKVVAEVYGRQNLVKYVDTPNHHRIERKKEGYIDEKLKIKSIIIDTNDENRMVNSINDFEGKIKLRRQVYNSYNVYLALLKMALSTMPKCHMDNFDSSLLRIRAICKGELVYRKEKIKDDKLKEGLDDIRKSFPNIGVLEFRPGVDPFGGTGARIYKRINECHKNPLYLFQLSFGNYAIYIPVLTDYELDNQKNMKLSISSTSSNSSFNAIDFTKMEEEYICDYITFGKKEIPKEMLPELSEYLKENGWLDKKQ
ncbi:hypothetical protein [Clostridium novyi]|uniref:hypothetical protein n=1 Tax=Clostridium novyi TaxID=1542 RepID=UPI0011478AF9|nr:hypothetical protein [Clostridium novyi]